MTAIVGAARPPSPPPRRPAGWIRLSALAPRLRVAPPRPGAVATLLEAGAEGLARARAFVALVEALFEPGAARAILGPDRHPLRDPGGRIERFVRAVEAGYCPLDEAALADHPDASPVDPYPFLAYGVPVAPLGLDQYALESPEELSPATAALLTLLCPDAEGHAARVDWLRGRDLVPAGALDLILPDDPHPATIRAALGAAWGEAGAALAAWATASTGNLFLDLCYDREEEPCHLDWDRATFDALRDEWREAREARDAMAALDRWLAADLAARYRDLATRLRVAERATDDLAAATTPGERAFVAAARLARPGDEGRIWAARPATNEYLSREGARVRALLGLLDEAWFPTLAAASWRAPDDYAAVTARLPVAQACWQDDGYRALGDDTLARHLLLCLVDPHPEVRRLRDGLVAPMDEGPDAPLAALLRARLPDGGRAPFPLDHLRDRAAIVPARGRRDRGGTDHRDRWQGEQRGRVAALADFAAWIAGRTGNVALDGTSGPDDPRLAWTAGNLALWRAAWGEARATLARIEALHDWLHGDDNPDDDATPALVARLAALLDALVGARPAPPPRGRRARPSRRRAARTRSRPARRDRPR